MVKLTKVTLLQISGEKLTDGSRVDKKRVKDGEKSISWPPNLIKTRSLQHVLIPYLKQR